MIEFKIGDYDETGGTPLQLFLERMFEHCYNNDILLMNKLGTPGLISLINKISNQGGYYNCNSLFQYRSIIYQDCYKNLEYYKLELQKPTSLDSFPNTEEKLDSIVRHKDWIMQNSKVDYLPLIKHLRKEYSSIVFNQPIYSKTFNKVTNNQDGYLIIKEIIEIQFDILNTIIAALQKAFRILIAEYLGRFADEFPGGLSTHILYWNNDLLDIDHFLDELISKQAIETFPPSSPRRMKDMIKAHFVIISNNKRIPPKYSNISLQKIIWKGKRKLYIETINQLIDKHNKVITVDRKIARDVVLSELHEIFAIPEYSGRGSLKLSTVQTLFKLYLHDRVLFDLQNP